MDSQKIDNNTPPIGSQPNTSPTGDDIFVVKPEPKEPPSKKTIWVTVAMTVLGILVLIAVFMAAVIGSAGGLADNYRGLAYAQIKKLDKPLKTLEPSTVLNNRNVDSSLSTIYISEQAQPSLENTLFVGSLNAKYVDADKTQKVVKSHYKTLDSYTTGLGQLIKFDDDVAAIMLQEPALIARINPSDTLSIRSVGGSYQTFADQINKMDTPDQIDGLQQSLAKTFSDRASAYKKWATAVEAGDKAAIDAVQVELKAKNDKALLLVTDKEYIRLFKPTYQELLATQKTLESKLSN